METQTQISSTARAPDKMLREEYPGVHPRIKRSENFVITSIGLAPLVKLGDVDVKTDSPTTLAKLVHAL